MAGLVGERASGARRPRDSADTGSPAKRPAVARRTVGPSVVLPNLAETKMQWAQVIQKSSENKINVKNAWNVNTHFESLPHLARELGESRDFHASGVTIESAAKVFSYKVDALLMQSSKVQTAITRGDDKGADDDKEEATQQDGANPTQKRPRKRAVATATIAAPYDLNLKASEQQNLAVVDPLYAQTSSKFDQGGASGLLVLNCPLGQYVQIQLDSGSNTVFDPSRLPATTPCSVDFNTEAAHVQYAAYAARAGGNAAPPVPAAAVPPPALASDPPAEAVAAPSPAASPAAPRGSMADDAGAGPTGDGETASQLSSAAGDHGMDACMEPMDEDPAMDNDAGSVDFANSPGDSLQTVDGVVDVPEPGIEEAAPSAAASPQDGPALFQADQDEAADAAERIRLLEAAGAGAFREDVQFRVADTLELDETQQQEVYDMHQGQHGAGSSWQGPFDTTRWRLIRKALQGEAAAGAAAGGKTGTKAAAGAAAGKKKKATDVIDFDLDEEALAAKLALAKKMETLLLPRGKERCKAKAVVGSVPAAVKFLDADFARAHARQGKILLPEDHLVTTDVFFKLHCLPERNFVQHRQEGQRKKRKKGQQENAERIAAEVEAALEAPMGGLPLPGVDPADAGPAAEVLSMLAPSEASDGSADWGDEAVDFGFDGDDNDDVGADEPIPIPAQDTLDSTLPDTPLVMNVAAGPHSTGAAPADISPAVEVDASLMGLALVDRPVEVAKGNVAFAKKAKVVDMKKLKDATWEVLSQNQDNAASAIHRTFFVNVIRAVQGVILKRKIAATVLDVTLPLYFIALLHLCNEKGLQLTHTKDGSMDPRHLMIHSMGDSFSAPAAPAASLPPP